MSSGLCCPSPSIKTSSRPRAARMPLFTAAPLPILYGWRTTLAPPLRAISALLSNEPSSTTMISARASLSAWILPSSAVRFAASLNTGITIEISQPLAMKLEDAMAAIAKLEFEPALGELVPQSHLIRAQIVPQKLCQKIPSDHEMSNLLALQCLGDFLGSCGGADRPQKISGQVAAIMKILPLVIIRSPSDKEKVNFRRLVSVVVDILQRLRPER